MGVTKQDIFGGAEGAQPAKPGTYGQPPEGHRLPDATRLGAVRLQVADLNRSQDYYERVLGLRTLERDASHVVLAAHGDETPLIHLHEHKGAKPAPSRGVLGLYHFAILLPDRPSLGRLVRHLGDVGARVGSADHLVSEALYLQDPDNLGIEVYADRPRESWRHIDRQLLMATDPIDIKGLIDAAGDTPWSGMPKGTAMGHMHLHVGDIERAGAFYSDGLGFDRMVWQYPGALFLAAGGYHHHLGTNTWAGRDAVAAPQDIARLMEWTIELPDTSALNSTAENIERAGHVIERDESGLDIVAADPWGTRVRIRSG